MESQELGRLVDKAEKSGDLLGVQLSTEDEANETPWLQPPSKRQQELSLTPSTTCKKLVGFSQLEAQPQNTRFPAVLLERAKCD